MRPIKFRAYDKKQKRWLTDLDNWFTFDYTGSLYLYNGDDTNGGVDPVLMQFTGLRDKRGVEIYEGDICFGKVRSTTGKPEAWQVIYEAASGAFCYKAKNGIVNPLTHAFSMSRELKVIGNMWDNPELLGGVKEDE